MVDSFVNDTPLFLSERDLAAIQQDANPLDPTTIQDRQIIAKWYDQRIRPAKTNWMPWFAKIAKAYAFYENDTYLKLNEATGALIEPERTNDPRVPSNHFATLVNAIVSRILSDRPMPVSVPGMAGNSIDDNKTIANLANLIMRHVEKVNRGEDKEQLRVLHALLGGMSWKKAVWDASRTAKANMDGQIVEEVTGEILITVHSALEVLMQPCTDFEYCQWLIHAYDRPLSYVADEWENGKYVIPTSAINREVWLGSPESYKGIPAPKQWDGGDKSSIEVKVFECYERTVDESGKQIWTRLTFCEDTLLEPQTVIGPNLPLTPYWFNCSLYDCSGTTLAWDLIPLQEQINRINDGQAKRLQVHQHPKPLVPEGADYPENFFDNTVDPVVCPVDANGKMLEPSWMVPPPLDSQGVEHEVTRLKLEMDDIAGIHETSRGMIANNITSGKQAQIAAGQDNTNLQRAMANWKSAESTFWTNILEMVVKHYPDGKVVEVVGKDGALQREIFKSANFSNPGVVEMKAMSRIPFEPQQKIDFATNMLQGGLLNQPPEVKAEFYALLGFDASPEEEVTWAARSRAAALKQIEQLRQGIVIEPFIYQDMDLLLKLIFREVNTLDFLGYEEPVKRAFKETITKILQLQTSLQMAMQPPMPVEGGMPFDSAAQTGQVAGPVA